MGLARPALHFLIREHRVQPLSGALLTLGRQTLAATRGQIAELCAREGLNVPAEFLLGANTGQPMTDVEFFKLLGLHDIQALDYSAFEGAQILHDLNTPVAETLQERFDVIVDGGTLEHVFDVRAGLRNMCALLRPGGRVIHISPANNWLNHGFYQFSPTLYFDFYSANHFTNLRGFVVEQPLLGFEWARWEFFSFVPGPSRMVSKQGLMNFFVAEKTAASTGDEIPIQSFYQKIYAGSQISRTTWLHAARTKIPQRWQAYIAQRVPWLNPYRKPWGLKNKQTLG